MSLPFHPNPPPTAPAAPDLWGGIECTVNRVGERYFDQLERGGHARRLDDLDRIAGLGVRALRYPVLWERTAPHGPASADWSWADARLARLRALGVRPIVGFVHHGSGPRYTSLVDPRFPEKLAEFAAAFARRYPWVENYTPVNEPLTTARFSGLYGHWYPHGRDDRSFLAALVGQCRGVALAMQAVRRVNPQARLVQTEDLGKTHSTAALAPQARFENHRRWLSFDLLCGRVTPAHPLWRYLRAHGVGARALDWAPCPPDVLGLNYYITSERFLDARLERWPPCTHGGNGKQRYADVEAVRALARGPDGVAVLLREVWARYGRPMAVTEVHLGCTRDEQMRWFHEVWGTARDLRAAGLDLRAVTAWALLGSHDWDSLLTRDRGHYECGAFDVRSEPPRETALGAVVRALARGETPDHPALDAPGWWRRDGRLFHFAAPRADATPDAGGPGPGEAPLESPERPGPESPGNLCSKNPYAGSPNPENLNAKNPNAGNPDQAPPAPGRRTPGRRAILITGARGTLGRAFARICELRGLDYVAVPRGALDIADPAGVERVLDELRPWAVINAAGYVRVDAAEREPDACFRGNTLGPTVMARACGGRNLPFVTFSSDLVFDGALALPYHEEHRVGPLNVYGRSKAQAEVQVLDAMPTALVVRTSAFFGPWDDYNFVTLALRTLAAGQEFRASEEHTVSPTYVPDVVHECLDLLIDGEGGVWHLANQGAVRWAALARALAAVAGKDPALVRGGTPDALGWSAVRPRYSVLGTRRGSRLRPLETALSGHLADMGLTAASPAVVARALARAD